MEVSFWAHKGRDYEMVNRPKFEGMRAGSQAQGVGGGESVWTGVEKWERGALLCPLRRARGGGLDGRQELYGGETVGDAGGRKAVEKGALEFTHGVAVEDSVRGTGRGGVADVASHAAYCNARAGLNLVAFFQDIAWVNRISSGL